jgi:hypothetical protein
MPSRDARRSSFSRYLGVFPCVLLADHRCFRGERSCFFKSGAAAGHRGLSRKKTFVASNP